MTKLISDSLCQVVRTLRFDRVPPASMKLISESLLQMVRTLRVYRVPPASKKLISESLLQIVRILTFDRVPAASMNARSQISTNIYSQCLDECVSILNVSVSRDEYPLSSASVF